MSREALAASRVAGLHIIRLHVWYGVENMDERAIRRAASDLLKEAERFEHEAQRRRVAASVLQELLPEGAKTAPAVRRTVNGHRVTAGTRILEVMREAGRPVTLDEIRSSFIAKGQPVPKSLHETIRRLRVNNKIVWVDTGTYALPETAPEGSGDPVPLTPGPSSPD
jgi:hypothetical protein